MIKNLNDYNISTSYFRKAGKIPESISVCVKTPPWFCFRQAKELFCSKKLYNSYFNTHKISQEEFIQKYMEEVLFLLDPTEIMEKYRNTIFLGWHKPNEFDVRNVICSWIKLSTGIIIPEWES